MKFSCERCGKKYATAETPAAGRVYKIKCKACGHLIVVKASAEAATSATTEMRPPTLAGIPAVETPPPRTPEHHPQATPDIQLEVAPPEPAAPPPAEEHFTPPAGDVGYVDLFEDGPKQETEKPAEDPFIAAARASLPDGRAGGSARPDPFAALREEFSATPASSTPPPRTPPSTRAPKLPKIPAIPRPVLKKALLPVVLIVAGALVLVGILAYVLLGGSRPPREPRQAQAPAAAQPRPVASPAAPEPPPPAPVEPVPVPPPAEKSQKADRRDDERRAREEREREAKELRERQARDRERQARELREREAREHEARERREREARDRERERAIRDARAREEREAKERDRLARDERDRAAREAKERDRLAREEREREAREAKERERFAREQRAREEREARERERQRRESEKVASASAFEEEEGLSQGAIEKVLGATRKSFESCIVRSGGSGDVQLDGRRVMLRLNIQSTGAVTYPTLDDVTLNGTELGSCLKNAARQMVFPRFKGETMHIEVPLVLVGR